MIELAGLFVFSRSDQFVLPYCDFFLDFELRFFEVVYPIGRQFVQLLVFVQNNHFRLFFQALGILIFVCFEAVAIILHVLVTVGVIH